MPSSASAEITLIDGRSGAGKTMFAKHLADESGALLVSVDDVYPGWDGLDAGSWHIHHHLLEPRSHGMPGRYRPWLWAEGRPGDWVVVPADRALIVEGCGVLRRGSLELADTRVWLEQDDQIRRERALERDGEMYAPHWTRWALQEVRFLALHSSRGMATVVQTLG